MDELLARVSVLEAENAQLRQISEPDDTPVASTPPPQTAAVPELDMSAWDDYGLQDLVISSLAKQKFTAPTDIQHECLPAAIIGHADIVGAAQTVCTPILHIAATFGNAHVWSSCSQALHAGLRQDTGVWTANHQLSRS